MSEQHHRTITIVSGFGRCGSSVVMQMLHAAGMPMAGRWPSFEDDRFSVERVAVGIDTITSVSGCAIKVLDPHLVVLPRGPAYRAIWLTRDPVEQAKSQAKLLRLLSGVVIDRATRRKLEHSYSSDELPALAALRAAGVPTPLHLTFEALLANSRRAAENIASHCGLQECRVPTMAAAVQQRRPQCAPDMALELALLAQGATV
jgi:hypothetical protein